LSYITQIDFSPEFRFQTSRSRGSGGQNVNKVETRVELIFNVGESQLLNDPQKERILQKLTNRIDNDGNFHVTAELHRSQLKNKELVIEKFYALIEKALAENKPRKKTRPSKAKIEKRLQEKKQHGQKKRDRKDGFE
jgi:ribosome-associated protein